MKKWHSWVAAAAAPVVVMAAAGSLQAQEWHRGQDWVPGVALGSSVNNPGPGAGSPGIWRYEFTQGGALGSGTEWFNEPRSLLRWDDAWWNTGMGAWTSGDELSPPIMQDRMIHNLHTSAFDNVPVLTWNNPMGDGTQVDVTGSLRLRWSGKGGVGMPVDIDLVLGLYDATSGITSPLLAQTYSKPTNAASFEEEILIPLSFNGLGLDTGDAIVLTHRGREAFSPQGMWVTVFDSGMAITLVPSPGAVSVLALAGLAAARRRRN